MAWGLEQTKINCTNVSVLCESLKSTPHKHSQASALDAVSWCCRESRLGGRITGSFEQAGGMRAWPSAWRLLFIWFQFPCLCTLPYLLLNSWFLFFVSCSLSQWFMRNCWAKCYLWHPGSSEPLKSAERNMCFEPHNTLAEQISINS